MTINKFITALFSFLFMLPQTVAMEELKSAIKIAAPKPFHEYPMEYFQYAETPLEVCRDVLSFKPVSMLEIGPAKGYFINEVAFTAREEGKRIAVQACELNESNRLQLQALFEGLKAPPFSHSCTLAKKPNVVDYIHHSPELKREFFNSIVSFYTFHCLCPTDLIRVVLACHVFLKSQGILCLTLQSSHCVYDDTKGFDEAELLQKTLDNRQQKGDLFPGFNLRGEEFLKERIRYFISQPLDYPTTFRAAGRKPYDDPYKFAHDFCNLLPTIHDKQWTRKFIEHCGFEVVKCESILEEYPARPLKAGELSNENIQTGLVVIKAKKTDKKPDDAAVKAYMVAAQQKEEEIFNIYRQMLNQESIQK